MSKQRLVYPLTEVAFQVQHDARYVYVKLHGVWITFGPVPKDWDLSNVKGRFVLELDSVGESQDA